MLLPWSAFILSVNCTNEQCNVVKTRAESNLSSSLNDRLVDFGPFGVHIRHEFTTVVCFLCIWPDVLIFGKSLVLIIASGQQNQNRNFSDV